MKKILLLGALLGSVPAWAGTSTAFSYGGAAVQTDDKVDPEGVISLRNVVFPQGPIGLGVSMRAHAGPEGHDVTITPDLCVGTINDEFIAHLCGGMSVANWGRRDGAKTKGLFSPVIEPTIGIPLSRGDAGTVFLSVPAGYDVRYGQSGSFWAGVTVGFGFSGG